MIGQVVYIRARVSSTGTIPPALRAHVAEQLKDESSIQKEARKAREERVLQRAKQPNPKPKKKGKGGVDAVDVGDG